MSPVLVLIIMAAYFAVLFGISYVSGRKADNQGFFTGNRKSSWYVVAFAMIASAISGVTFVSVPGMVGTQAFSYLQMVLGFAVGQFLIAFVLIPLFYKMNLTSIYEYLENRFGLSAYRTGAWFFFISKMLGAAVRLYLVCLVFQLLVFDPLRAPFGLNVIFTVFLVWLYTHQGGVKSLIWTDSLKTFCLIVSVGLSIYFVSKDLGYGFTEMTAVIRDSDLSKVFFFEDIKDGKFFFKQFLAGVFLVIATTGLDQDFMQKNLSCRNQKDAQKNMVTSGILQIFVILLFLVLGLLLYLFAARNQLQVPAKTDDLFPFIATGGYFPLIVGVLFVVGLISSAYAAAGSALTALTTSFTVDILESTKKRSETAVAGIRKKVHVGMAVIMGLVILLINLLNNTSVINAVYILASYTYGPILGMFVFGIFTRRQVRDRFVPLVALLSPVVCFVIDSNSKVWFNGYEFSHERLILNAMLTFLGLLLLTKRNTLKMEK
ncbi:MAG: sodium:solute symporter [Massilibacteroides sp.]|nr:sodium:solute symporter [Massilibacteroides sp.]MDD3062192.1 sodium:solute symporter [Massilibacteroides sp.]MDD4114418.1 sodium:solute symporter [Massilibacteroides sp.]MDD4659710.1 sodium:solute symporter [Massilibacteroides sp.]